MYYCVFLCTIRMCVRIRLRCVWIGEWLLVFGERHEVIFSVFSSALVYVYAPCYLVRISPQSIWGFKVSVDVEVLLLA